jgi:hypothetical protein
MPTFRSKSTRLDADDIDPLAMSQITRAEKQESTRSQIALLFVGGYLAIIAILICLSAFGKLNEDAAKDYLIAIGTQLGFIIGFYFKSSKYQD